MEVKHLKYVFKLNDWNYYFQHEEVSQHQNEK